MELRIRRLAPSEDAAIALVARRMRATLVELLGASAGQSLYSPAWLEKRARSHLTALDPTRAVLVAELDDAIVGHVMTRLEREENRYYGLVATVYVCKALRRKGIASALWAAAEQELRAHGAAAMATNTATDNDALRAMLERRGYAVALRDVDRNMVHLRRDDLHAR